MAPRRPKPPAEQAAEALEGAADAVLEAGEGLLDLFAPRVRSWESLGASQRKRYIGAGLSGKLTGRPVTEAQARAYYESGGNLERAQGHIKYAAPNAEALRRLETGRATNRDVEQLRRWQERQAPRWLRNDIFTEDTAAKLAGLKLNPAYWKRVGIYYHSGGNATVYIESTRGGRTRKIELSAEEVQELRNYIRITDGLAGKTEVYGTDTSAPEEDDEVPTTNKGTPVPRRKRKK